MARIIYVEDDELVGAIVQQALTAAGHLAGVIAHGTLAFETICFKRPDMVILDCSLPGMSGIEILERIRVTPEIYHMPILMLTGRRTEEGREEAMLAGANEYLTKPFEPAALLEAVERVLRHNDLRRTGSE